MNITTKKKKIVCFPLNKIYCKKNVFKEINQLYEYININNVKKNVVLQALKDLKFQEERTEL